MTRSPPGAGWPPTAARRKALAGLGASPTVRAHHVALSARPGDEAAIAVLERAASQVAARRPRRGGTEWLTVALSLLPADEHERRLGAARPLAEAQAAAGGLAEAHGTLLEITAELPVGSGSAWSQAVAALASVELALGRHSGARRRLESALAAIPDGSSADGAAAGGAGDGRLLPGRLRAGRAGM